MSRAARRALLVVAAALLALDAAAQPARGIDYREVVASSESSPRERIEVTEFFWYRCPHCYEFESLLNSWGGRLPADVVVKRVPVVFSKEWEIDARIFYALESMGEEGRLRADLYDAIHRSEARHLDGRRYVQWVEDWLSRQGIDMARFRAARTSSTVDSEVQRARRMTIAYRLEGTPTLAINRRCFVDADAGDHARMLAIASYLVNQARRKALCP